MQFKERITKDYGNQNQYLIYGDQLNCKATKEKREHTNLKSKVKKFVQA
jgi:hypothetical protein